LDGLDLMARAKLTVKQDKFAREYAKDGNGTRAAKAAGYSHHSAQVIATENLSKPLVSAEIRRHRQRTAERLDVSREKLVNDAAHDAEAASSNGDYSAANANRTFVAKALGYHVERSMSVHVDVSLAHLDALKQMMGERVGRVGQLERDPVGMMAGARRALSNARATDIDADHGDE
jgi:phage terminase small subunit